MLAHPAAALLLLHLKKNMIKVGALLPLWHAAVKLVA
jgi:hypothetical protein